MDTLLKNTIALLFTLLLVAGCGEAFSKKENSGKGVHLMLSKSFIPLKKQLKKDALLCLEEGGCPKNVGMLYSLKKPDKDGTSYFSTCTGFLISEDTVATNSHCVSDLIKENPELCSEKMAIKFLTDTDSTVHPCTELLEFSDHENTKQDFAFFKINKTDIKPFKISKKGVSDNEELKLIRVTPLKKSRGGFFEISTCTNKVSSFLSSKNNGQTPWSHESIAFGCKVIRGNSGSPILNIKNEVVGINASFTIDSSIKSILEDAVKRYNPFTFPDKDTVKPNLHYTNIACVKDPVTNTVKTDLCEFSKNIDYLTCSSPEESNDLLQDLVSWKENLPSQFLYKITKARMVHDEYIHRYAAEPYCTVRSKLKSTEFTKNKKEITYVQKLFLQKNFVVDSSFLLDFKNSTVKIFQEVESKLIIKEVSSNYWEVSRPTNFWEPKDSLNLPECSDEELKEGNLTYTYPKTHEKTIDDPDHPVCNAL